MKKILILLLSISIFQSNSPGPTALMIASRHPLKTVGANISPERAEAVLATGVDINEKTSDGYTALSTAFAFREPRVIKMLLERGADPNAKMRRWGDRLAKGETALIAAAYYGWLDIVRLILESAKKPDINEQDNEGNTAILTAAKEGHTDIVKLLLDKGADPTIPNSTGITITKLLNIANDAPTHETIIKELNSRKLIIRTSKNDLKEAKKAVEGGANVNTIDENGNTPLILASRLQTTEASPMSSSFTLLTNYLAQGNEPFVRYLLEQKANINAQNKAGNTALLTAINGNKVNIIDLLLKNNADVTIANNLGETPLMRVIAGPISKTNKYAFVESMLKAGADPKKQDNNGQTALTLARQNDLIDIVNILEAKITGKTVQDIINERASNPTPGSLLDAVKTNNIEGIKKALAAGEMMAMKNDALKVAVQNGSKDAVELLLEHKADPNIFVGKITLLSFALTMPDSPNKLSIFESLLKAGANPNAPTTTPNRYSDTILMQAALENSAAAKLLLQYKADVNHGRLDNVTPLLKAAVSKLPDNADLVDYFLDKGALKTLNTQNMNGVFPLLFALREGRLEAAKRLLARNANPNLADNTGQTPIMIAAEKGLTGLVQLLLKAGANPALTNKAGKTALDNARAHGHKEIVKILESRMKQKKSNLI